MNHYLALSLLIECTGDEIWSVDYCRQRKVPDVWIEELVDGFESGYTTKRQTIFVGDQPVTQYEGVRDVDLACKLGEFLGVDLPTVLSCSWSRVATVKAIQDAVEEG